MPEMAVWERLAPACRGSIQPLTCMSPTRNFPSFADRQLCHKSFWWHKSLPSPSSQGQCKEERGRRVGSCALAWQRQAGGRRGAVSRVWAGWGGRREKRRRGSGKTGSLPVAAAKREEQGPVGGAQEGKRLKVFRELNHHSCLFPSAFVLPLLNSDTYTILCLLKTMLEFPTLNSANKCVLN